MDKFPRRHLCQDSLSFALLLPDGRNGWYKKMVLEYNVYGVPVVQERKGNVIGAGSGAQDVFLNHESESPRTIESQSENEK